MKTFAFIVLAILCAIGVIISSGFYALQTKDIKINYEPLSITNASLTLTGFSSHIEQLTISPNNSALPNTNYKFIASIGSLSLPFHVSWDQTQLDIKQPMIINAHLTNAEYTYIIGQKYVNITTVYHIEHTHDVLWIILIIAFIAGIIYSLKRISEDNITNHQNLSFQSTYAPQTDNNSAELANFKPRLENSTLTYIRQFKPRWIERDGKHRLEGKEEGNNANLAHFLSDNGIPNVYTEVSLKNGSRVDILIDDQIIIECKPHLLSVDNLHSISGELRRVKRIGNYKIYALIYGDAKSYLLNDLKADIGENNVIVLGEIKND
jgi:hypothetical protein